MSTEKKADKTEMVGMDSKEMIARNNKAKTKFHRKTRMRLRVIKATHVKQADGTIRESLKVGMIIEPHKLMAEQLIKDKICEVYKN